MLSSSSALGWWYVNCLECEFVGVGWLNLSGRVVSEWMITICTPPCYIFFCLLERAILPLTGSRDYALITENGKRELSGTRKLRREAKSEMRA